MVDTSLVTNLLAVDKISGVLDNIGGNFGKFGKVAAASFVAIGGAGVVAGKLLYEVGATFDDLSDTIRVGTGATGEALDGLVDVAKNVGKNVPVEFDKIGPVVADLNTRLGLTGDTLQTVASQYLQAGHILGEDVDIKSTTAAMSVFGIQGDQVSGSLDQLFRVSQATGVGMNELAGTLEKNGGAVQQLGFSFSESASLVGVLDKAGIDSNAMLSSMSKGLVTLAQAGEDPKEAFRRVTGGIKDFVAAGDDAGALDMASKVFGTRGAAQFVAAVKSGKLNIDDMATSAGLSTDTIIGVADDTADMAEQWQLFKNRALVAIEPIATKVFNLFGNGMKWFNDVGAPALANFATVVQTRVIPFVVAFAGFVVAWRTPLMVAAGIITAVFLPALIALGVTSTVTAAKAGVAWVVTQAGAIKAAVVHSAAVVGMVAGWVLMGIQSMIAAAKVAAAWLISLGPIALVIAAVVGLVAIVVLNWETIKNAITTAAQFVIGWLSNNWPLLLAILTGPIGLAVLAIVKNWDTIKGAVTGVWDWIVNVWNNIVGFIGGIPRRISSAASGMWDSITGAVTTAKQWVTDKLDAVVIFVADLPRRIADGISNIAAFLAAPFISAYYTIKEWVDKIISKAKEIKNAITRTVSASDIIDLPPDAGTNAQGTSNWRGGLTWVGERGPELINLDKGAQVFSNPQSMAIASQATGGSGGVTNNTFNMYELGSPQANAAAVGRRLAAVGA